MVNDHELAQVALHLSGGDPARARELVRALREEGLRRGRPDAVAVCERAAVLLWDVRP